MIRRTLVFCLVAALAIVSIDRGTGAQQLSYSRGQNISPAFEGWEKNDDGSFNFLFGYMNRNWEEEIDVPIGPDNTIQPGPVDQGQPTHFLPRRNRFVFRVRVPKDFGNKELIWTLTVRGKTEKAYATLRQDYFVDDLVQASEQGALGPGASNPTVRANKKPVLRVDGETTRSVRVGEPLTLVAWATDDGVPRARRAIGASFPIDPPPPGTPPVNPAWRPPAQVTVGSATGLRLSWYVYRGPPSPANGFGAASRVTFSPNQIKVWEDTRAGANSPWAPRWMPPPAPPEGKWVTEVTFDTPGTYVLRCLASDGAIGTDRDVTVTVMPKS
jgi:hypothetical protein